jgi:predicted glycosyltransferase/DNA-binding NarL/FixJ family response regulator
MVSDRRVLIVEDESIVQLHLRMVVQELGYSVSGVAATAAEAIRSADSETPHLVLMDIRLPGGTDGIEAARELRARYEDLAVVFLTAYGDDETVARAQEVGAEGFIVKPFNTSQLRATLSTAFRAQSRMKHTRESESLFEAEPAQNGDPMPAEPRAFGAGTRMAIFSHDTLGLGHLQRCTNISRALSERYPGLSILLLTGSPAVHRYSLPQGVDYIKLPAVRKVAAEEYSARTLGVSDEGVRKLRTNLLLRSIQDYDPHVLLVDHSPLGVKRELLPTFEWLRRNRPACIRMLGLRDVLDSPEAVTELWDEQGTYQILREHYDHLLVYGCPEVFDPAVQYRFSPDLVAKVRYCNYVCEAPREEEQSASVALSGGRPLVVVTIGGGDGGGEQVIGTYLEMLRRYREEVDFESLLLTGPFLPEDLRSRFASEIRGLPARMLDFVSSTRTYLEHSALVVSTCGYNTTTQNLAYGKRAIVVPRVMYRQEQLIRARRLEELGLLTCIHPDEIDAVRLYGAVRALLANTSEPLTEGRARGAIRLDGTDQIADFCGKLVIGRERGARS